MAGCRTPSFSDVEVRNSLRESGFQVREKAVLCEMFDVNTTLKLSIKINKSHFHLIIRYQQFHQSPSSNHAMTQR